MTTIDEKMLREFRQDFKAAVLSLEKKYGISIEAKRSRILRIASIWLLMQP